MENGCVILKRVYGMNKGKAMIFSELSAVPESNTFIHGDFHPGVLAPMLV